MRADARLLLVATVTLALLALAQGCAAVRRAPQRATVTLKNGSVHVLDDAGFETPSLIPDARRRYRLVVDRDESEPAPLGVPRMTPVGAGTRGPLPLTIRFRHTFDVDRIERLEVGEARDGRVPVTLVFRRGGTVVGHSTGRTTLGGGVAFGARRIRLEQVESVAFEPQRD